MSASPTVTNVTPGPRKLGTFGGVFTPSILTILGVIMFLRFGQVTGNAGVEGALVIVVIANAVSVLTSLSLAVVASNTRVAGGGDYFLISRSLGLEAGGAIGAVLYVAQSVSVGLYVVGFSEALRGILGTWDPALKQTLLSIPTEIAGWELPEVLSSLSSGTIENSISTLVCIVLFVLAFKGADIATRAQYFIMGALVLALASYFGGALGKFDQELLESNRAAAPDGLAFWATFAIFFPAITGFTQGVSMSGDLKDAQKSLPRGTFLAVAVSLLVYLALPYCFAGTTDRETLVNVEGTGSMKAAALVPWLVDAGVFAATLSSALASMMGAPRILRAMSMDRLFPGSEWLAQGRSIEPRRPLVITFVIALVCIWAGDLNTIASVVTMFFLLSYGALNFGTFIEGFSRNPSFRPRFRFSGWRTALAGAVVCGAVMFAIDPLATVLACIVLAGIHRYLVSRDLDNPAGDARRGFYVQRIKDYLIKLGERPSHARTWRPVVLAVTSPGEDGRPIAQFAGAVGSQQGILTIAVVLVGPLEELVEQRNHQLAELDRFVRASQHSFFFEVPVADTYALAIRSMLITHGIGHLRPNTLLLYWRPQLEKDYLEVLHDASLLDYNVVMLCPRQSDSPFNTEEAAVLQSSSRTIDVWWRGMRNGWLALLLAHLVRETRDWRGCTIRLLRIVRDEAEHSSAEAELIDLVERSRIEAEVEIVAGDGEPFDIIAATSGESHLVFMGVSGLSDGSRPDLARYNEVLDRLPTTALVFSPRAIDVGV